MRDFLKSLTYHLQLHTSRVVLVSSHSFVNISVLSSLDFFFFTFCVSSCFLSLSTFLVLSTLLQNVFFKLFILYWSTEQAATAAESYPRSEVRDSGLECQAAAAQEQRRGGTLHARPGAAARRSKPTPKARGIGQEEQPHLQAVVAARAQEGLEEQSQDEGQKGRREEIPLIQGMEQCCALLEQP